MEMTKKNLWKEKIAHFIPAALKDRGRVYVENGRVELAGCTREEIAAVVYGTRMYDVKIGVGDKGAGASMYCSCPYFAGHGVCKHVWAAAVEADMHLDRGPSQSEPRKSAGWEDVFLESFWRCDCASPPWAAGHGSFKLYYHLEIGVRQTRLSALERYVRKGGGTGRARYVCAATIEHPGLPRDDRVVMAILEEIKATRPLHSMFKHHGTLNLVNIPLETRDLAVLLPALAGTGRCLVTHHGLGVLGDPLAMGRPLKAFLRIEARKDAAHSDFYNLLPFVQFGDQGSAPLGRDQHFLNTAPVYLISDGRLYEMSGPSYRALMAISGMKDHALPAGGLKRLLVKTLSHPLEGLSFELPSELEPEHVNVRPRPNMLVDVGKSAMTGRLAVDYAGFEADPDDDRPYILDVNGWRKIWRSLDDESSFKDELKRLGFEEYAQDFFVRPLNGAAEALYALAAQGWSIFGNDRKQMRFGRISGFRVSSGIDWFDLEADVSFGAEAAVSLPEAVRAFLKGERLVRLGDGGIGLLPEEWIGRNLSALEGALGDRASKRLRFMSSQALVLDSLLEEKAVEFDDGRFLELARALKGFAGVKLAPVPALFKGRLHMYQQEALGWFSFLKQFGFGGMLADDMGLGKTIQVLAMLAGEAGAADGPSLIVAPTSLVFNWQREAERFVPDLKMVLYCGPRRLRMAGDFKRVDIVLTTYAVLRRDIEVLRGYGFNYIILDESQVIKNAGSVTAKAVRLLNGRRRLCLTGTPLENHAGELWAQMDFLNPGLLGPLRLFEARFVRRLANGDEEALDLLKKTVRPFILRRTKEAVAAELPEKVEKTILCRMTDGQARLYDRLRRHYLVSIAGKTDAGNGARFKVLEGLLRLRQAAAHPGLLGEGGQGSGKLDELMLLLDRVVSEGHKALIFSQFTSMLALIRDAVSRMSVDYEYLDGKTPGTEREERVKRFQSDEGVRLFLISLKAGGVGLNLTAADYVFLVDPWWNPAVELQAVDRTHRIGQDKKVFTYRLISEGTVEEKVMALQDRKRRLVGEFLSGNYDMLKRLSKDDIMFLFS